MDPTSKNLGMEIDPDALDACIDQAVDELFVDRTAPPEALQPAAASSEPVAATAGQDSPWEDGLTRLKQHLLALDWEINAANIEALRASVCGLKEDLGTDLAAGGVLTRMEELCEFLDAAGPEVRPESVQFLHTATRNLHLMVQTDVSAEQRESSAAEVEQDFKDLGVEAPQEDGSSDGDAPEVLTAEDPEQGKDAAIGIAPEADEEIESAPAVLLHAESEQPVASDPEPMGPEADDELPLLEPEELLPAEPLPIAGMEQLASPNVEELPLLEPEPDPVDSTPGPGEEWSLPTVHVAPEPGSEEMGHASANHGEAEQLSGGTSPELHRSVEWGRALETPEEDLLEADQAVLPSALSSEPAPVSSSEAAVSVESGARMLAALESSRRLEEELECANQEVGAFFDRILRATEGKPHLERLAASFSSARDAVAQRLASTEEIACDLRAQLAREAQAAGPLPGLEMAPRVGCPLGGEAREITGAAGQIQEAVAMLQETLAVLMSQQPAAPDAEDAFPTPAAMVSDPPQPEGAAWSP